MKSAVEIRAEIDTETVRALLVVNGGSAAGLMTLLPLIIEKPGLHAFALGAIRAIICAAAGLALAIYHNRLRRKCSLQYDLAYSDRQRPCSCLPEWMHSAPNEPCICTRSVFAMWLSLVAFIAAVTVVGLGAWTSLAAR